MIAQDRNAGLAHVADSRLVVGDLLVAPVEPQHCAVEEAVRHILQRLQPQAVLVAAPPQPLEIAGFPALLARQRRRIQQHAAGTDLLGKRQPHIYGHETLADVERDCRALAKDLKLDLRFHQSNREDEIIDWIHEARETAGGIVINPAAFTHTSVAILDALNTFEPPVIEVHISNVHKRESFRHHSYVSLRADGVIAGLGTQGYGLGLRRVAHLIDAKKEGP